MIKNKGFYSLTALLAMSTLGNASPTNYSALSEGLLSNPTTKSMLIKKTYEDSAVNDVTTHLSEISNACDADAVWEDGIKLVQTLRNNYLSDLPQKISLSELYNYAHGDSDSFEIKGPNGTKIAVTADKADLKANLPNKGRVATYAFASAYFDDNVDEIAFDRDGFQVNYKYNVLGGFSLIQGSKEFPVTLRILFSEADKENLTSSFKSELATRVRTICDESTNLLIKLLTEDETDPKRFVDVQLLIQKKQKDFLQMIEKGSTRRDLDELFDNILRVGLFLRDNFADYRAENFEIVAAESAEDVTVDLPASSLSIDDHKEDHRNDLRSDHSDISDHQEVLVDNEAQQTEAENDRPVSALKRAFGGGDLASALKARGESLTKVEQSDGKEKSSGNELLDALKNGLMTFKIANSDQNDSEDSDEWSDEENI